PFYMLVSGRALMPRILMSRRPMARRLDPPVSRPQRPIRPGRDRPDFDPSQRDRGHRTRGARKVVCTLRSGHVMARCVDPQSRGTVMTDRFALRGLLAIPLAIGMAACSTTQVETGPSPAVAGTPTTDTIAVCVPAGANAPLPCDTVAYAAGLPDTSGNVERRLVL